MPTDLVAAIEQSALIVHLIAFALGAGAAFTTDVLILTTLRAPHRRGWHPEVVRLCSRMVWLALAVVTLSGAVLFLTDPVRLASSPKFLTKMVVVAVIAGNGWMFHRLLAPRLAEVFFVQGLSPGATVVQAPARRVAWLRHLAFAAGAVSITSWLAAIVLGGMRSSPLPFGWTLGTYAALLAGAVLSSQLLELLYSRVQADRSRQAVTAAAARLLDEPDGAPTWFGGSRHV